MVEVGVWKGATSFYLLEHHPELSMILVDPWSASTPEDTWMNSGSKMALTPQRDLDEIADDVQRRAVPRGDRVQILRDFSHGAAPLVPDASQDLIFIDADHSYEAVSLDVELWLPKVKPSGILSGHDYDSPRFPGVKTAVDELLGTVEVGDDHTWFYKVPGTPRS